MPSLFLVLLMLAGCSSGQSIQDKRAASYGPLTTPAAQAPHKEPALTVQTTPAPATQQPAAPAQPSDGTTKVALLLPLSGKGAPLGQAMVNAAQLAVFDVAPQGFELMPRDTGSTPEATAKAAKEAIEGGAKIVIGPLFAADVATVRTAMHESDVNVLALSTDTSLAQPGIYVMGFAPAPQVDRIISYAAAQGAKRFAALIPQGPYGVLVQRQFEMAVSKAGATVVAVEGASNVSALAQKKNEIDALFLPLGGQELRRTAGQLASVGFSKDRVKVLGTGLWDEARIASGEPFLEGALYAAPEPERRAAFTEAYQKNYGQQPPRLATLAYDATALAAVLARSGGRFDRVAITNPSGFAGLDGIFRFAPDGHVERGLAIHAISGESSKIVEPSPSAFSD
jgi:ABC-type branched-subunit amino acid transport system substrate-binding protein